MYFHKYFVDFDGDFGAFDESNLGPLKESVHTHTVLHVHVLTVFYDRTSEHPHPSAESNRYEVSQFAR